ncbi:MAG: DoxX family protein [Polyangiaceae bacterium]
MSDDDPHGETGADERPSDGGSPAGVVALVDKVYSRLTDLQCIGPLLARICVGYMFAKSGYNLISKLDAHANYFRSLGVPAPEIMAPIVVTLELVGGTLLILGIGTRIMSATLAGVMAVALLTEHFDKVKSGLSVLFYHSDFLLILLLLWLVLAGPGKLSVDHVLRRKLTTRDDAT